MDVEETRLPGIGLRHDFMTESGRRVGVVSQRTGARHLMVYDEHDPDSVYDSVELSEDEAQVMAELLGAPRIVERLARLRDQVEGLATVGLPIRDDSPFVGRTLADSEIRSRTGASVVAVVRGDEIIPSPTPDVRFRVGDRVVVVGTETGVRDAASVLDAG